MKTIVETFVIEETSDLIWDDAKLDQWNEYVKVLNLGGQEKIVKEDKSPIPFLPLKTSMVNVLTTLCPRQVDVQQFDISPIPVEILSLVSLSVKEKYFERVEIWYDEKNADPCCIGIAGYWYQGTWGKDRNETLDNLRFETKQACIDAGATGSVYFQEVAKYLIGKWADVKHSFEQLKAMAHKRYVAQQSNDFRKTIKEYQRKLDDLETEAFDRFN